MITNFNRILVGVDDSEDSKIAFKYAVNHAIQDKAELVIVSILENDEMNVYQALNKDFVHGERAELEKHLIEYKKEAQSAGVSEVLALFFSSFTWTYLASGNGIHVRGFDGWRLWGRLCFRSSHGMGAHPALRGHQVPQGWDALTPAHSIPPPCSQPCGQEGTLTPYGL